MKRKKIIKNYIPKEFLKGFSTKNDFITWLKSALKDEIKKYIREYLVERKVEKNLVYSLGQVELRSLGLPGINYFNNLFDGDYYKECEKLGFINKYEKFIQWGDRIKLDKRRIINIDTREQKLLQFNNVKTNIQKLGYGDYSFSNSEWVGKVVIERKGLSDLIGTLFGGYERFEREIGRAKNDGAYLIILVEANLGKALNYRENKLVNCKVRIPPQVIFHQLRKLTQKYNHIQFLFVDSHEDAGKMVENLFSLGGDIKKYDLQYLLDKGEI